MPIIVGGFSFDTIAPRLIGGTVVIFIRFDARLFPNLFAKPMTVRRLDETLTLAAAAQCESHVVERMQHHRYRRLKRSVSDYNARS